MLGRVHGAHKRMLLDADLLFKAFMVGVVVGRMSKRK